MLIGGSFRCGYSGSRADNIKGYPWSRAWVVRQHPWLSWWTVLNTWQHTSLRYPLPAPLSARNDHHILDDNTFRQNKGGPLVFGTFVDYSRKGNGVNAIVRMRLGKQHLLNQRNIISYLPWDEKPPLCWRGHFHWTCYIWPHINWNELDWWILFNSGHRSVLIMLWNQFNITDLPVLCIPHSRN